MGTCTPAWGNQSWQRTTRPIGNSKHKDKLCLNAYRHSHAEYRALGLGSSRRLLRLCWRAAVHLLLCTACPEVFLWQYCSGSPLSAPVWLHWPGTGCEFGLLLLLRHHSIRQSVHPEPWLAVELRFCATPLHGVIVSAGKMDRQNPIYQSITLSFLLRREDEVPVPPPPG